MVCAALLLMLALACSSDSEPETVSVKLALDWYPNSNHLGLYIAQNKGYFADENLDVELYTPVDPSTVLQTVGAGQDDSDISSNAGSSSSSRRRRNRRKNRNKNAASLLGMEASNGMNGNGNGIAMNGVAKEKEENRPVRLEIGLDLDFERGEIATPKGHALVFFRQRNMIADLNILPKHIYEKTWEADPTLKDSAEVLKRLPELPKIMEKANQALTFMASGQIPQNSNSYSALKNKELEMKSFRNQSIIGLLLLVFLGFMVF